MFGEKIYQFLLITELIILIFKMLNSNVLKINIIKQNSRVLIRKDMEKNNSKRKNIK